MTKKKLEGEIAQLEKELANKNLSAEYRPIMQGALDAARDMLEKGRYSDKPTKTDKAAQKIAATVLKKAGKNSSLEDCEDIIKRAREARKNAEERIAKRKRAGKPSALTVPETVKKAAKAVEKKVEKKGEQDKHITRLEGIEAEKQLLSLCKKIIEGLSTTLQRQHFVASFTNKLMDLVAEMKGEKAEHGMRAGYGSHEGSYVRIEGSNFGLHIIKNPAGTYSFVGSIPMPMLVEKKGKNGLIYLNTPSLPSREAAKEYYKEKMGEDWPAEQEKPSTAEHGTRTGPVRKGQMRILHYKTENFEVSEHARQFFERILAQEDLLYNQRANVISLARSVDDFLGIVKRTRLREAGDKKDFVEATGYVMLAMYRLHSIIQAMDVTDQSGLYPSFLAQDLFIVANHTQKTDAKLTIMEDGGMVMVEEGDGALSVEAQEEYHELMDEYDSMAGPRAKEGLLEHVYALNRISEYGEEKTPEQEAVRAGRARFLEQLGHRMQDGGYIDIMEIVPVEGTMRQGGATDNNIEVSVEGNTMNVHNYNGLQAAQLSLIRELQKDYIGDKSHDEVRDHTYEVLKGKITFPEGTSDRNKQRVLFNLTLDTMAKAVGREGIYKEGGKVHEHQREVLTAQGEEYYEELMAAYNSRKTDSAREEYRTHIQDMRHMAKKDQDHGYQVFRHEPAEIAAFDKFLMMTDPTMKEGGKVTFKDKVHAIEKKLKGENIPEKFRKGLGKAKKYTAKTAHAAAQRITGAMESGEKGLRHTLDKARNSLKKKKGKGKKKMLFGGITVGAPAGISSLGDQDNLNIHSMS